MADGGAVWQSGTHPVKTLWVLERASEEVRVEGRRLDGPGVASFRRSPGAAAESLLIPDPARASTIPGTAAPAMMRAYAFIPSYVFYPSPGCWEFVVRVGGGETRIVRDVKVGRED